MTELEPERLRTLLRGGLGNPYLYAVETSSTQDVLRSGDHPQGAVAVAEYQTAGRGRSGRTWEAEPSTALLFSVLLRPPRGGRLPELSLVAGLAVAAAVERQAEIEAQVKWPNDVLVGGGKVAGILLEASGPSVVCGIGINVNQQSSDLPPTPRMPATSLRILLGRRLDRGLLLADVLLELERRYTDWLAGGIGMLGDELERRNALRGRRVSVPGGVGTAGAIAADGRLTVDLDRGDSVLVESGEVELEARF